MVKSRYPRPRHRLAPAALSEVLQVPLPEKYQPSAPGKRWKLAELDERAWQRFGPQACRELAREIVRAVGRAVQAGLPTAQQRIPAIPRGMTLADLELESRTLNCLAAAGIAERPQLLQSMTIGELLALRGFGAKSLLDLLTALEYARAHPASGPSKRVSRAAEGPSPAVRHRYPRPGEIIAPQTLRELLAVRVPLRLARGSSFQGRGLCELDERVWSELAPEKIAELGRMVVVRAGLAGHWPTVLQRRLPQPPKGMRLEELRLENRTYNCLLRAGLGQRPAELGKLTVGQLLAIPSFGAKCLVDLLSALETRVVREGKLDRRLSAAAASLLRVPEAAQVVSRDPRLGPLLRAIDPESRTLREAAERLLSRRLDPPDPAFVRRHLQELRRKLVELRKLPLEEELRQIFACVTTERDCRIVSEYYGFDGRGGRTLSQVGCKHRLSRERVRQICARAARRCGPGPVFAPVLDRALAFLAERHPAALEQLQRELDASRIVRRHLPIASIRKAAELLSRRFPFALVEVRGGCVAVAPSRADLPGPIARAARRMVANYGVGSVKQVVGVLPARLRSKADRRLLRAVLEATGQMCWLDKRRTWFRLACLPRYGLPGMIKKVLAVAGRLDVGRMHAALGRYRRGVRRRPPAGVLLEFCRQMPGVRVEGRDIVARRPKAWWRALTGVERKIVEVLKKYGPVLERGTLEEHCLRRRVNRFSFNAALMSSPVIVQYGRRVYGLLGPRVLRRLLPRLAQPTAPAGRRRVLEGFGHTRDGRTWVVYRLSKAAVSGGVVTVPAALKARLRGHFALRLPDQRRRGTLVVREGCAWGLGPALRAAGAREGDYLLLTFSQERREARLQLGDRSLLEALGRTEGGAA